MLCLSVRHFIHCLVLVQPRKTRNRPNMTEKLLTNQQNMFWLRPKITWKKLMENNCSEWKITTVVPQRGISGDQV